MALLYGLTKSLAIAAAPPADSQTTFWLLPEPQNPLWSGTQYGAKWLFLRRFNNY